MNVRFARRAWISGDRLRRRWGFDRNRLRRGIDRLQQLVALTLLLLYVATATVLTAQACHRVYAAGLRTEKTQAATRHRAPESDYRTWLDSRGNPTNPPQTRSDTLADTLMAGSFVPLLTGIPFLTAYGLVRRRLDVRREQAWDREWQHLDRRPTP
ncbi:hypothetical protein J4573_49540 [Actinomadura barringtoniae]|uniref:Uncharacterized protein n=1 Tax=Actinomadura barringtoniae TaxID=1427535 RepID=A0A939PS17_9ACTN|nr:hypothetical protein [Actinomadura barringtoniae]MBO2455208.1 hypothetical protein [Actinomadura barringtoniae]